MTPRAPWVQGDGVPGLASVVIPARDRADVIRETLDSVWNQTHRPVEVIFVDDGSTDGTRATVDAWAGAHCEDGFSLAALHQEPAGAPAARNRGAAASRGSYVQFLDSDDLLLPEKLSRSIDAIKERGVMFASCDYAYFAETTSNVIDVSRLSSRSAEPQAHVLENKLNTLSPLFLRAALCHVGPWREDLQIGQDTEFSLRVLLAPVSGFWMPEVLAYVRYSSTSIMNQDVTSAWSAILHTVRALEEAAHSHGRCDAALLDSTGRRLASISRQLALAGSPESSRAVYLEAMKRLRGLKKASHMAHRAAMRVLGCSLMEKLGFM